MLVYQYFDDDCTIAILSEMVKENIKEIKKNAKQIISLQNYG